MPRALDSKLLLQTALSCPTSEVRRQVVSGNCREFASALRPVIVRVCSYDCTATAPVALPSAQRIGECSAVTQCQCCAMWPYHIWTDIKFYFHLRFFTCVKYYELLTLKSMFEEKNLSNVCHTFAFE